MLSPEKAISLSKIIEAIDLIDHRDPILELIRNNELYELNLKTFGMLVWFLKESLIEHNLRFFKFKVIPD